LFTYPPVLSVRQPAADHLIFGWKRVENWTWATKYRGPLLIHASRFESGTFLSELDPPRGSSLVVGHIIGLVPLVDIVTSTRKIPKDDRVYAWPSLDGSPMFFWLVTKPFALAVPIRCKGRLGVCELPKHHRAQVRARLSKRSLK
jgi:hypothetical protein